MDLPVNQIICGDCLEVMKGLPDKCIDLTVTSPPYDNLRTYNGFFFDFEGIAKELYRITKDGGVVVWVVGDATINGSETGTSFRQALYFRDVVGFRLHDTMIYEKSGGGAVGSIYSYWQNFEYMFVFTKGKLRTFNPIEDRPNKVSGTEKVEDVGRRSVDGTRKPPRKVKRKPYGKRFNLWRYGSSRNETGHPAIFPEQLANDHIISWSNPGDLVLDPFVGSGTTAKMALLNGRNYIGVDISEEYCEIARKRISKYTQQQSIV